MFSKEQFAKLMDSTMLKPRLPARTSFGSARRLQYHFATVVVFPFWLPVARRALQDSDVKTATVIGFPYGASGRSVKLYEAPHRDHKRRQGARHSDQHIGSQVRRERHSGIRGQRNRR